MAMLQIRLGEAWRVPAHALLLALGCAGSAGGWVVAAALALPGAATAQDCPRPPGVPAGARYSCPTRTQTQQPGEPRTNHPGGSPGRGTVYGPAPGAPATPPSVHCQIEQDGLCHCGPRRGTGRNIPCRPDMQPQPAAPAAQPQVVFNYYYLNGINTPQVQPGRGNYAWDMRLIRGNLLDLGPRVGDAPQRGAGYGVKVKVGSERDLLYDGTYNLSGTDHGYHERVAREFCAAQRGHPLHAVLCPLVPAASAWDHMRASVPNLDVLECALQSGVGMRFSLTLPLVHAVANHIAQTYADEARAAAAGAPRRRNYFILIGHSQGNFFTEAIAYALFTQGGASGSHVARHRLGILALASPTSYNDLTQLPNERIKYYTRADDIILGLAELGRTVRAGTLNTVRPKTPFPPNRQALWPWPQAEIDDIGRGLQAMGLQPPAQCRCPSPDDALYMPLMNSHLIDNYLSDPTLTEPGRALNPTAIARMQQRRADDRLAPDPKLDRGLSPATPAVLGHVRSGLVQLKRELLRGP